MSKRFTGTDVWGQDWFLDMPNEYKLFWNYMLCECNHAGVFKANVRPFNSLLGSRITKDRVIEMFNSDKQRVRVLNDSTWFIEDFICFQYGAALNPNNRVHLSIIEILNRLGVNLTSIRGLGDPKQGVKDKDKDKDISSLTNELFIGDEKVFRTFDHLSITNKEVSQLLEIGYTQYQIDDMIDRVQNYHKNKNFKSLYLTVNNWLKKDYPEVSLPKKEASVVDMLLIPHRQPQSAF